MAAQILLLFCATAFVKCVLVLYGASLGCILEQLKTPFHSARARVCCCVHTENARALRWISQFIPLAPPLEQYTADCVLFFCNIRCW
jgi:hypothetical protein